MQNNIEILSRVIMDDASHEARSIIDKARMESESITEEGVRKAGGLKRAAMKGKVQIDLSCNKAKAVSLAEFQARSEILGCKEGILSEVLRQVQKIFFSLPDREDYPEIVKGLIMQAIGYLRDDGDAFVCRVNERDRSLLSPQVLEDLGKRCGRTLSLDTTAADIVGGVMLYRTDFRVLYDNSLEAIFERNRRQMRRMAAECIFENGKQGSEEKVNDYAQE
ncbi:MAG: V-type ATP synthase subunit E [bacterium]